jgi:hypothetical protein
LWCHNSTLLIVTLPSHFSIPSHNMSTSSSASNSSVETPPLNLSLAGLRSKSSYETPLTSCPDSPKSNPDDYFLAGSKIPAAVSDDRPSYPKVNNVCFVGAGFVGTSFSALDYLSDHGSLTDFLFRWPDCCSRCIPQPSDRGQCSRFESREVCSMELIPSAYPRERSPQDCEDRSRRYQCRND